MGQPAMRQEEILLLSTLAFRSLQAIQARVDEPLSCAAVLHWRVCGRDAVQTTISLPISFYSVIRFPDDQASYLVRNQFQSTLFNSSAD